MAEYSVAAAKDRLSSLIAKAEAGEEVIITRRGKPAVELRAVQAGELDPDRVRAAHEWLKKRVQSRPRIAIPSAELLRQQKADYRY